MPAINIRSYHPRPTDAHYEVNLLGARIRFPGHDPLPPTDPNQPMREFEHTANETRWMTASYYHTADETVLRRHVWLAKGDEAARQKELRAAQLQTFDLHRRMHRLRGLIAGCEEQWLRLEAGLPDERQVLILRHDWGENAHWYVDCGSTRRPVPRPLVDTVHLSFEIQIGADTHIFRFHERRSSSQYDAFYDRMIEADSPHRYHYAIDVGWLATFSDLRQCCFMRYRATDNLHYWVSVSNLLGSADDRRPLQERLLSLSHALVLLNSYQGRYLAFFLYKTVRQCGFEGRALKDGLWPRTLRGEPYFLSKLKKVLLTSESNADHRLIHASEQLPPVTTLDGMAAMTEMPEQPNGKWQVTNRKVAPKPAMRGNRAKQWFANRVAKFRTKRPAEDSESSEGED